jgi:molybdopterin molybdotransferase
MNMNNTQIKFSDKNPKADDVRMRGFKKRAPVSYVMAWLNQQSIDLGEHTVTLQEAVGRTLAHDVISQYNIPLFERSMMDGYALIASDTHSASSSNQLQLHVIGKSMPGHGSIAHVTSGATVRIMTGAPIPSGANAVLPAENVEIGTESIMVMESVAEGRNIGRIGEDVRQGSTILKKGRCLRPQDIALLASVGEKSATVFKKLRISIVITGNEILDLGKSPQGYQIINSNGSMLEALSRRDGAHVINSRIVPDDIELIRQAMQEEYDILLITGGTSVGEEDIVPLLLAEAGELAIHGVAMRPSRSTGMGSIGKKLVFLLPGNPVACLCAYDFFAGQLIRRLSVQTNSPYLSVKKILKQKLASIIGRTDYARVRLSDDHVEPIAISGAAILSSTTQADGFVIIPENSEGYPSGAEVTVYLYD